MPINDLKDRVSAVHVTTKKAAMEKLPESQLNSTLVPKLSAAFDSIATTMAIDSIESQAAGEGIVQEIALEDVAKAIQSKDPEYIVGLLAMLGLLPLSDEPALKFAAYVKNLQDPDVELEAKIDGWFMTDSEEKLSENLQELIAVAQEKDREEDEDFMKDLQDVQMLLITMPNGGLTHNSSRDEVRTTVTNAARGAMKNNPKVTFSQSRLDEATDMIMAVLDKNPGLVVTGAQVQQDGEINFVFAKNAVVMGLKMMPDAAFEPMKLRGEAATVSPALKVFTEKPGDITNNMLKGAVVKEAVGRNASVVPAQDESSTMSSPFSMSPFNTGCKR
jgi:hypothetical protein